VLEAVRRAGASRQTQNRWALRSLLIRRRTGELLIPLERSSGGRPKNSAQPEPSFYKAAIDEAGLSRTVAKRWQILAEQPQSWYFELEAACSRELPLPLELTDAYVRGAMRGPRPVPDANSRDLEHMTLLRFMQPTIPTATIIALILRVAFPDADTALDVTYGNGAFWDGSAHVDVTAVDQDETRAPNGTADFQDLPYDDEEFDVVLLDPPHVADGGKDGIMAQRFGTYTAEQLERAVRIGTAESWRASKLGIIVKVTDAVHGSTYVSESDWVRESIDAPLYDVVHQTRSGALVDPKWDEQLSAYNNGSTYLVFRKDGPLHKRRGPIA
jgi:hypothetical protein